MKTRWNLLDLTFDAFQFVFERIPAQWSLSIGLLGGMFIEWLWRSYFPTKGNEIWGDFLAMLFTTLCTATGLKVVTLRQNQERLLSEEINLSWVQKLNWREFEDQAANAYRQLGFQVEKRGGDKPDGGIDFILRRENRTTAVQCKHWKQWRIGVSPVRELLGAMTAEKADEALFIASGDYTEPAKIFAQQNKIKLIDKHEFVELIRQFRHIPSDKTSAPSVPACPICQAPMLKRLAKKAQPLAVNSGVVQFIPNAMEAEAYPTVQHFKFFWSLTIKLQAQARQYLRDI